jgi:superfamily II DNA/RNA helicase
MLDYEKPERCIIFANTQNKVESIFKVMGKWNDETGTLHGGMDQSQRMKMISKFKRGELKYLIATDLASRGLHVRNLSHVINFNLPFEFESYVHRIGRTGRVNETGIAINLCSYKESERMEELQDFLGYEIERKGPKKRTRPVREVEKRKGKFKPDKTMKYEVMRIHAGRCAHIKAGDVMQTLIRIPGVDKKDLGRIDVHPQYTLVEVNRNIIDSTMSALRKRKLKGKAYRIQKMTPKWKR